MMAQLLRKLTRAFLNYDPSFCDMYEDAHARAAAEEYLAHIRRHLQEQFGDQKLSILDAGCQAGRLLIPLAEEGHQLIGVDTSGFALRRARRHAQERRLPVRLHRGSIAGIRSWVKSQTLDVVICTEVLYLCEDYRELFRLLVESVKPGGLVCISHRPAAFYVANALAQGRHDLAAAVARSQEGPTADSRYHNWQTEEELRQWYRAEGLRVMGCYSLDHTRTNVPGDSASTVPQYLLVIARKDV